MKSPLELGVVVKPHGVRGAIKVHLHNAESSVLQHQGEVILAVAGEERHVRCRYLGEAGDCALLSLEDVQSREAAEQLRGARILVDRQQLEPLAEDEYLYEDLIGCRVEDEGGQLLGTVEQVFSAGASDVLVVSDGAQERLIPLVDDWVLSVDVDARQIRVAGGDQWEPSPR